MDPLLRQLTKERRILLAVAAPIEARALLAAARAAIPVPQLWQIAPLSPHFDLLLTGVSKSNAAGALASVLSQNPTRYAAIINTGIAGSLPSPSSSAQFSLHPTNTVAATHCVFADEGIQTPAGYQTVAAMGFPISSPDSPDDTFPADPTLLSLFTPLVTASGPIATVSTCSGTDLLAREVALRTSAIAESMEGAACALISHRLRIPFIEVRAISNFTGDRAKQAWDIKGALVALESLFAPLFASTNTDNAR